MIMRKTAVLDACVLYSAPLRDFLLYLGRGKLYEPKWTTRIHEEWIRNLSANRPDLKKESFRKTRKLMDTIFPDALIIGFEEEETSVELPDLKDTHVLAAAIKSKAKYIVTYNVRDFPARYLQKYKIKAINPDEFILMLIHENPVKAITTFQQQLDNLTNPPISQEEMLEMFRKIKLSNTANLLDKLL